MTLKNLREASKSRVSAELSTGDLNSRLSGQPEDREASADRRGRYGGGLVAGLAVFLAPLAKFNHLSAVHDRWLRFFLGPDRIGRQVNFGAVGAELSDGAGMALIAGDRKFEVIHTGQALLPIGISDKANFFQRHVVIEQLDIEFSTMLFDPL